MATQYIKLKGKLKWAQNLKECDEFRGSRFWKITMYDMDEESQKRYDESGIQCNTERKKDKDGDVAFTFRRREKQLIRDEVVRFDPPNFTGPDGGEVEVLVANGSEGVVDLAVFDTAQGKGHRLQGVHVTKLIEYKDDQKEEEKADEEDVDKEAFA